MKDYLLPLLLGVAVGLPPIMASRSGLKRAQFSARFPACPHSRIEDLRCLTRDQGLLHSADAIRE